MVKSIQNSIFKKLIKIGIISNEGKMQYRFMKFSSSGLMDLNVDKLYRNKIALAHNGIQNGDVMADPDIEILIHPKKQEIEALSFQNDYVGIYQQVYDEDDKCNKKLQNDIDIFLDEWLSNIINCEYKLTEVEY